MFIAIFSRYLKSFEDHYLLMLIFYYHIFILLLGLYAVGDAFFFLAVFTQQKLRAETASRGGKFSMREERDKLWGVGLIVF